MLRATTPPSRPLFDFTGFTKNSAKKQRIAMTIKALEASDLECEREVNDLVAVLVIDIVEI